MGYIVEVEDTHKVLVFEEKSPFLEYYYAAARKGNDLILISASRNAMCFLERKYKSSKGK
jgi:hypothetical protein